MKRTMILAIALVAALLTASVGGTIAWFTDEVASANNVIKSGTLDVEVAYLEGTDWKELEEKPNPLFDYSLWEPGYTVWKGVKISNVGDLAFKYKLNFAATAESTGEYKLENVIDVYQFESEPQSRTEFTDDKKVGTLAELMGTDGSVHGYLLPKDNAENEAHEDIVYIGLKMQESAGNEYQNLSVGEGFGLTLVATQYTYEEDSFGNDYDANALYPVYDASELAEALAAGKSVKLEGDVELTDASIKIPANSTATLDLNGNDITATSTVGTSNYGLFNVPAGSTLNVKGGGDVVLKTNVTKGVSQAIFQNDGVLNIYGGNYEANQANSVAGLGALIAVVDNCVQSTEATLNIYGGTFTVTGAGAINIIRSWPIGAGAVTNLNIYGGTFKANPGRDTSYIWNKNDTNFDTTHAYVNVEGGTFEGNIVLEVDGDKAEVKVAEAVELEIVAGSISGFVTKP